MFSDESVNSRPMQFRFDPHSSANQKGMTDCDVVIIVRSPAARLAILNGLTEQGERSITREVLYGGTKVSFFRNHDGRKVAITVSAAKDPRARMEKMSDVAKRFGCSCVALINAEYNVQDMKRRRTEVPDGCAIIFLDDVNMLLEVLGYQENISALQREVLKPLFPAESAPKPKPVAAATVVSVALPPTPNLDVAPRLPPVPVLGRSQSSRSVVIIPDDDEEDNEVVEDPDNGSLSVSTGGGRSTIRAGPGSTIISGVNMMDAATLRSIMERAPGHTPNVSRVVAMPANAAERAAVTRANQRSAARNRPREFPLVNEMIPNPPYQRSVPTRLPAPPVPFHLRDEANPNYQPLVAYANDPPGSSGFRPRDAAYHRVVRDEYVINDLDDDDDNVGLPFPTIYDRQRPQWLRDMEMASSVGQPYRGFSAAAYGTSFMSAGEPPPSDMPPGFQDALNLARRVDAQAMDQEAADMAAAMEESRLVMDEARRLNDLGAGPMIPIDAAPPAPAAGRLAHGVGHPRTARERREMAQRRMQERAQQRDVARVVLQDRKVKKAAVPKPREEDPDIQAMCTTAEDNTCTICQTSHITATVVPCGHTLFCYKCIKEWTDAHGTCTACRAEVVAVIQLRTKFDAQTEHKKIKLDPAADDERKKSALERRKERAAALKKEAEDLEAGIDPE
jgi:hypothetical protein